MVCSTVTSALVCRVISVLRERGGKTESTLCSLVKLVKGKSDYPACLAESQGLEGQASKPALRHVDYGHDLQVITRLWCIIPRPFSSSSMWTVRIVHVSTVILIYTVGLLFTIMLK